MDSMNDRLHPSAVTALAAPELPPANGAKIPVSYTHLTLPTTPYV